MNICFFLREIPACAQWFQGPPLNLVSPFCAFLASHFFAASIVATHYLISLSSRSFFHVHYGFCEIWFSVSISLLHFLIYIMCCLLYFSFIEHNGMFTSVLFSNSSSVHCPLITHTHTLIRPNYYVISLFALLLCFKSLWDYHSTTTWLHGFIANCVYYRFWC